VPLHRRRQDGTPSRLRHTDLGAERPEGQCESPGFTGSGPWSASPTYRKSASRPGRVLTLPARSGPSPQALHSRHLVGPNECRAVPYIVEGQRPHVALSLTKRSLRPRIRAYREEEPFVVFRLLGSAESLAYVFQKSRLVADAGFKAFAYQPQCLFNYWTG